MKKQIIIIISLVLILTISANIIYQPKIDAIAITASVGLLVFSAIAIASGIVIVSKTDLSNLYDEYLKLKPPSIDYIGFAKTIFSLSLLNGKYAFDKSSDVVKSVIEYLKSKISKVGYESVRIGDEIDITNMLEIHGLTRTIDLKAGINQILSVLGDKYVLSIRRPNSGMPFLISINGIGLTYLFNTTLPLYQEGGHNLQINYINVEETFDNISGVLKSVNVTFNIMARKRSGTWEEFSGTKKIDATAEFINFISDGIYINKSANIYSQDNSIISGHDISADLKNPTLPLSVSEGIIQKHDKTFTYTGDIDAFINDLSATGVLDKVLEWQLGKTREVFVPLDIPIPTVNVGEGTITWPDTGSIDTTIPDIINPDIPLIWDDLFTNTDTDTSTRQKLDFRPFMDMGVTDRFPFCLPFDLIRGLDSLKGTSKVPRWELPILGHKLDIDFSQFNGLASIVRYFVTLSFIFTLILLSRKLMGA